MVNRLARNDRMTATAYNGAIDNIPATILVLTRKATGRIAMASSASISSLTRIAPSWGGHTRAERGRQTDSGDHRCRDAHIDERGQEPGERFDADVAQRAVALDRQRAAGGDGQESDDHQSAADHRQDACAHADLGDQANDLGAVVAQRGRNARHRPGVEQRLIPDSAQHVPWPLQRVGHPGEHRPVRHEGFRSHQFQAPPLPDCAVGPIVPPRDAQGLHSGGTGALSRRLDRGCWLRDHTPNRSARSVSTASASLPIAWAIRTRRLLCSCTAGGRPAAPGAGPRPQSPTAAGRRSPSTYAGTASPTGRQLATIGWSASPLTCWNSCVSCQRGRCSSGRRWAGFTAMLLAGELAPAALRALVLVDIVPDMDPSGALRDPHPASCTTAWSRASSHSTKWPT